jgi:hypothetical protein
MSEPCTCDQPTCPRCHPVMSRIIAGELGGEHRGVNIIDPGAPMPDQHYPDSLPSLGAGLAIAGAIIGIATVGAIIYQSWGWAAAGIWTAVVLIVLGAILSADTHITDGPYDGHADD